MANARSITSFTSGDHVRSLVRRRDRVYDRVGNHQLIEALESVVRSLRSSRSITAAIVESTTRHPTDLTRALVLSINEGHTLAEACAERVHHVDDRDEVLVLHALTLIASHGGDAAANLDAVVTTLHDRRHQMAERLVQASTASASARLLTWLPIGCGALLALDSPGFRHTLFATTAGWACLSIGVGLNLAGRFWTRRLVRSP